MPEPDIGPLLDSDGPLFGYDAILVGFTHASIIGCLRPDIAYPKRKIRAGTKVHTSITAVPCDCPDDHVEVWVRGLDVPDDE